MGCAATRAQLFQSCAWDKDDGRFPGLPKRNPGLELANAFSVKERIGMSSYETALKLRLRLATAQCGKAPAFRRASLSFRLRLLTSFEGTLPN